MKKKELREIAKQAERRAGQAELRASALAAVVEELRAQVETMRTHWRPVPITHPWQPKNPQCMLCDEPRDAARHQVEG